MSLGHVAKGSRLCVQGQWLLGGDVWHCGTVGEAQQSPSLWGSQSRGHTATRNRSLQLSGVISRASFDRPTGGGKGGVDPQEGGL